VAAFPGVAPVLYKLPVASTEDVPAVLPNAELVEELSGQLQEDEAPSPGAEARRANGSSLGKEDPPASRWMSGCPVWAAPTACRQRDRE
jgi:hypothetical protein